VCDYESLFFFCCDRSKRSPTKLVSRFPDHPEIGTLHDNFVYVLMITSFEVVLN